MAIDGKVAVLGDRVDVGAQQVTLDGVRFRSTPIWRHISSTSLPGSSHRLPILRDDGRWPISSPPGAGFIRSGVWITTQKD